MIFAKQASIRRVSAPPSVMTASQASSASRMAILLWQIACRASQESIRRQWAQLQTSARTVGWASLSGQLAATRNPDVPYVMLASTLRSLEHQRAHYVKQARFCLTEAAPAQVIAKTVMQENTLRMQVLIAVKAA